MRRKVAPGARRVGAALLVATLVCVLSAGEARAQFRGRRAGPGGSPVQCPGGSPGQGRGGSTGQVPLAQLQAVRQALQLETAVIADLKALLSLAATDTTVASLQTTISAQLQTALQLQASLHTCRFTTAQLAQLQLSINAQLTALANLNTSLATDSNAATVVADLNTQVTALGTVAALI